MLKENKKTVIWSTLAVLLPVLIGLCLWGSLPEKIPTHWNLAGEVDGWSSRAFAVFGLPGILMVCHLLCVFGTAMDPKHKNVKGKMLQLIYWVCPVIGLIVSVCSYAAALGVPVRTGKLVLILIGLLFVLVGNWLPKCRANYTVGIKLPWTLHSEENWNRTHRMAGPVWIAGGLAILLGAFLPAGVCAVLLGAALAAMLLLPVGYSYLLYKKSGE